MVSPAKTPEMQQSDRRQQACADAAVWVARGAATGQAGVSGIEQWPGIEQWLESDAAHAEALDRTLNVWDELGQILPDWKREYPAAAAPAPRRAMVLASLACALLACLLSLSWLLSPTVYRTPIGERRVVVLADGSRVTLNTGTELAVFRQGSERRMRLLSGEAMFDVAHDPAHPFIVEAAGRFVRAVGTSFIVRDDARRFDVILLTGTVDVGRIDNAATEAVRLKPGDRYRGSLTARPVVDRPRLDVVTAWRNGELLLDQTPLADAVAEINRYSSRPIMLQGDELKRLRLNGVFQTSDSASFASTVAAIYGLRVQATARELRIVGKSAASR